MNVLDSEQIDILWHIHFTIKCRVCVFFIYLLICFFSCLKILLNLYSENSPIINFETGFWYKIISNLYFGGSKVNYCGIWLWTYYYIISFYNCEYNIILYWSYLIFNTCLRKKIVLSVYTLYDTWTIFQLILSAGAWRTVINFCFSLILFEITFTRNVDWMLLVCNNKTPYQHCRRVSLNRITVLLNIINKIIRVYVCVVNCIWLGLMKRMLK